MILKLKFNINPFDGMLITRKIDRYRSDYMGGSNCKTEIIKAGLF